MIDLINEGKRIYELLGDELSQKIFCDRFLYSLTNDTKHLFRMIQYMPKARDIVEKLDAIDPSIPKYIYSAGIRGRAIKKIWAYDWKGFIDRNEDLVGTEVEGIPVVSCQSIKDKTDVVVVIPNRFFANEIVDELIDLGINKKYIFNLSETWNPLIYQQYFDFPGLSNSKEEVFVDVGAFDGLSTKQFLEWSGNEHKRIYIWEPNPQNMERCKDNLKNIVQEEKCVFIDKVSWDKMGTISFAENGILSGVDKSGKRTVMCSSIEHELYDDDIPTFIKMDIEGAELQALCGCSEVIGRYRPKLAISVYHKKEDIVDLPRLILSFNADYKLYLRHYSYADWDTVLYVLPR